MIVREAEGRADLLLQKGQARLEDVQREIDGLRMKRREVETSIEALVGTLNNTLEFIREQDARAREERILLHRPRQAEAPPRRRRGRWMPRKKPTATPADTAQSHAMLARRGIARVAGSGISARNRRPPGRSVPGPRRQVVSTNQRTTVVATAVYWRFHSKSLDASSNA